MTTIPAAKALLAVAQKATESAVAARAAAPRPRKPVGPEMHIMLMVAKTMEDQERAAWARLLEYICANGEDDMNVLPRIYDHLALSDGREVLVRGMDTAVLKYHAARILGEDVE